tara:strand:+ start:2457 stop:3377 length:921 start_codon:yes stop_codon:yes gene_type:complete
MTGRGDSMPEFGRLLTAMVTPFTESGDVDYDQAKRLAKAIVASGSDGVIICGTTGESPTLSHDEKLRLFAEIKDALGDTGVLVAGTGNYNTEESIQLSLEAQEIGVDGLLLVVPYYNRPTPTGLYQHFVKIAESVSLPCVLYNVPSRTGQNMPADTTIDLSHLDNIIGTKEAAGDLEQVAHIVQHSATDFRVWSGDDKDTLHVLAVGGYGVVSVASHIVGAQIKQMIDLFLEGNTGSAADIHRGLLPLFSALFLVTNPIPVKHALNFYGYSVGLPRLPLVAPDSVTAGAIESILQQYSTDLDNVWA